MTNFLIAGGWGYNNLGDEAILAGYLSHIQGRGNLVVSTVDPVRTRTAQGAAVSANFASEGRAQRGLVGATNAVLGGGGYLNGAWQPEVSLKLRRLARDLAGVPVAVHAVEARNLSGRISQRLGRKVMDGAELSVRDVESVQVVEGLGVGTPEVLPDAISLLYPYLGSYLQKSSQLEGRVLVNLLNIADRGDAHESEVDPAAWIAFCDLLLERLGNRAVGLVVGGGDYRFMRRWPDLPLIEPRTVTELISCLGSASGTLSVRMHPALISTMLGRPTVSVPYCGKVRPTLERIGVQSALLSGLDIDNAISALSTSVDLSRAWIHSHTQTASWLDRAVAG